MDKQKVYDGIVYAARNGLEVILKTFYNRDDFDNKNQYLQTVKSNDFLNTVEQILIKHSSGLTEYSAVGLYNIIKLHNLSYQDVSVKYPNVAKSLNNAAISLINIISYYSYYDLGTQLGMYDLILYTGNSIPDVTHKFLDIIKDGTLSTNCMDKLSAINVLEKNPHLAQPVLEQIKASKRDAISRMFLYQILIASGVISPSDFLLALRDRACNVKNFAATTFYQVYNDKYASKPNIEDYQMSIVKCRDESVQKSLVYLLPKEKLTYLLGCKTEYLKQEVDRLLLSGDEEVETTDSEFILE
jgi:hypothetical protein